jgi:hypothetical protein
MFNFFVSQGREFVYRIKKYFEAFTDFSDHILPFINTDDGKRVDNDRFFQL